LVVDETAR
jgi:hypothetical protein